MTCFYSTPTTPLMMDDCHRLRNQFTTRKDCSIIIDQVGNVASES
uniref:Uncharacterized protein n=1 Tax=Rhizophora mucronata TaxID=61149 RepID=A0A2P2PW55_RHIMU